MAKEAAQDRAIATQSRATAMKADQNRADMALKREYLEEYEDQNRKATYLALADLFGITPLSIYRDIKHDQRAQAFRKEEAAYRTKMMDMATKRAAREKAAHAKQMQSLDQYREWARDQLMAMEHGDDFL